MSRLSSLVPKALLTSRRVARKLIARAGELRDQGRFADAAVLYDEALRFRPDRIDLHVQCGHMFKEAGRYDDAERHYEKAVAAKPDDADLMLQIGHFMKVADRPDEARSAYIKALALRPGWKTAAFELQALEEQAASVRTLADGIEQAALAGSAEIADNQRRLLAAAAAGRPIQSELLPHPDSELLRVHDEELVLRRLGRLERTFWGVRRTLRGVEAVRGFAISTSPVVEIAVLVNGRAVHRGGCTGGYPLARERDRAGKRSKYVFNVWHDFGHYPVGLYEIEVRTTDTRRRRRSHREEMVIEPPLVEAALPDLDGLVSIDPADPRSLDDQINARATMVRPARRLLFAEEPRCILVQRIDQLGDMLVSVAALRRLRAVFPAARIVGLVSRANADPAMALGLFDEVIVSEFAEVERQRRRVMSLDMQEEVIRKLAPYSFDLAIDLSDNGASRQVLLLSGAKMLYGFRADSEVPGLDIDLDGGVHDRLNGLGAVAHANKMLGMIEWLAALSLTEPTVVPRRAPAGEQLEALGLAPHRRYIVLHDGARLQFSRWPYFRQLAQMLIEQTDLDVVLLMDGSAGTESWSGELVDEPRCRAMTGQMPFDTFDALLAEAVVFVGNDSGPKHLAALRGTRVVSIHSSRINWSEWGQQGRGLILSRKMPCAGCLIHYDPEECGRDFACVRDITVEEVFAAVMTMLTEEGRA